MSKNVELIPAKSKSVRAGALVWWLWEETHVMKVVGSNQWGFVGLSKNVELIPGKK